MAGNPNPSPETRFKAGAEWTGSPGGKTSEQRRMEIEAAEMSAKIRHAQLSTMLERLSNGLDPLELLNGDALRLFKDSEDRAHGTPKATTEMTGANGGPVAVVRYEVIDPPARE